MLKAVLKTGLYTLVLSFIASSTASAAPVSSFSANKDLANFDFIKLVNVNDDETLSQKTDPMIDEEKKQKKTAIPKAEPAKPAIISYTVSSGDTLTKIADANQTTWTRIFNKNTHIADQNTINPGDIITIPSADEVLTERPIAQPGPVAQYSPTTTRTSRPAQYNRVSAPQPAIVASSAGNTYYAGYCTWYAKSRRPDLPNRLGNANTWVARAAAAGIPTGSTPRAGAIGQQGMHVVYVESVNGDGTVNISEMNYRGFGVVSSRTAPASNFTYIY